MVAKVRGGDPELVTKIKETMTKLTNNLGQLSDCQMWEEVPGSEGNEQSKVDSCLAAIAQSTDVQMKAWSSSRLCVRPEVFENNCLQS